MDFQNCRVIVNNLNLMADRVSVRQSNSLSPSYSLGVSSNIGHKHEGPLTTLIDMDYYVEIHNEPNYAIITGLKSYQSSHLVVPLVINGYTCAGYINSYRLNISPNAPILASVTYTVFSGVGASIGSAPAFTGYNTTQGSGLAHYWTSQVIGNNTTGSLIEAGYSFEANWEPKYKIGRKDPYLVNFLSASESVEVMSEYDIYPVLSGQSLSGFIPALSELRLSPISGLYTNTNSKISFNIGDSQIIESSSEFSRDIVTNKTVTTNNY
jgi:hypothetical protein